MCRIALAYFSSRFENTVLEEIHGRWILQVLLDLRVESFGEQAADQAGEGSFKYLLDCENRHEGVRWH